MSDFHICRVCQSRWVSNPYQNIVLGGTSDFSLCATCNTAARLACDAQTPAMREEQRQRRIAHFGNDGTPPVKLHRPMVEADFIVAEHQASP